VGAGEVGVEHASYGLQASRCDDQRNRLNHSLCVFRRALGGGDGEVRGRQIDSLDRLGSPAAASDVANSTFRQFLFFALWIESTMEFQLRRSWHPTLGHDADGGFAW
jgi:hypothetical protein